MSKSVVYLILAGIIVIAAGLRLYGLDRQSLWYDEVAEETAFQRQFLIKTPTIKPYTPPLNLFFIYPMTKMFPGSDFALRMVPFTFGLISVPLLFILGKQMFDEKVGLTASFLLAVSPFHIWYSQEARMYALQWMLSLISLIFFLRMLEKPGRANYIGYVLTTTAGLYTHQLTVFLIMLQGLYFLLLHRQHKQILFKLLGVICLNAILYLPWIIYSLTSFIDKPAGVPKDMGLKVIMYTFYTYCAGFSIGPSLKELHLNQSLTVIKPYLYLVVPLIVVYSTPFILGLLSLRKNSSRLLLLLVLFVPIAGLLILNKIMPNIGYNVRYTGTALFGFLLILAKGICWMSNHKSKVPGMIFAVFVSVAITAISAYSYHNYQFAIKYHKPDIRSAVEYIRTEKSAGDAVLCLIDSSVTNRYDAKGSFQCSEFHINVVEEKELLDATMRKIVEGKKRLWLVLYQEWYNNNIDNVKLWLDTSYMEIRPLRKSVNEIANVRIYCYDLTVK